MSTGGGGGTQPTSQTVTQTNIPEYARPYAEEMLGQAQAVTDLSQNPYQPFTGQRFAGFSPMQAQAFQNVAGQQVAPQITDASNLAYTAAEQGLGAQQTAGGLQQQALQYGGLGSEYGALGAQTAPQAQRYGAAASGLGAIGAREAQQGFGAGAQYAQQATSPEAMQSYMSPYMQNVVDRQQQEAIRTSNIGRQAEQARAVGQGAFGGTRSAIVDAEMQRNLGTQLGDIQAQGLQRAYEQAQQAQQFGANLGLQGLQAGYQGLQTGIAGQEAGMRGIQTGLQATGQGIAGAQAGLQGVGQATSAGQYGLAGAQTGLQGAGTLGQLGGQQYEQEMGITDAMQKFGALHQQQQQQGLDFNYQQFLAQQQYPYQQLSYMSDLLRGVPSAQSAQYTYAQQPDTTAQLAGAGLAAYGAFGRKEGGQIKKYQAGGQVSPDAMSTMAVQELPSQLRRLSDTQLAAYARNVKDAVTLSAIQSELNRRQRARMPGDQPPTETTAQQIAKRAEAASIGQPRVSMAGGGIVALQAGGPPTTPFGRWLSKTYQNPVDIYGSGPAPDYSSSQAMDEYIQRLQEQANQSFMASPVGTLMPQTDEQRAAAQQAVVEREAALAPTLSNVQVDASEEDLKQQMNLGEPDRTLPLTDELPTETGEPSSEQPPQPSTQPGGGIMSASAPRFSTFDQFREMLPKGEIDPAQQAILSDMQQRIAERAERAEGKQDSAKYDAALMAGLAMMGGNSLADGIARAAQTGGAAYMASRKDAEKALDDAEKAELAFRQYELEIMKGNEDAARKEFGAFLDYTSQLATIDARYATIAAKGTSGLDPKDVSLIRGRIEDQVRNRYADLPPPADETQAAQRASDMRDLREALEREAGIPPLNVQSGGGSGGGSGGAGDRPSLSSFVK